MAEPLFLLQIVRNQPGYPVVRFPGGGPMERDVIAVCKAAILAKGVGVFRTEAHVAQAIEDGMRDAMLSLKKDARRAL